MKYLLKNTNLICSNLLTIFFNPIRQIFYDMT